jgi:hypothetical protein
MNIFEGLDFEKLGRRSRENSIGCPFHRTYGGKVKRGFSRCIGLKSEKQEQENICVSLCGQLFGENYVPYSCPCHNLDPVVVKETFWKAVKKWRESNGK